MASLTASYSGVVINQNTPPTAMYQWRTQGGGYIYQTFTLPANYQRGTSSTELNIPDISGFQFYVLIDTGFRQAAALDYVFQYCDPIKKGWITLASGTQVGSHSDGNCWFDVIFPKSVPITATMIGYTFRVGIQARTMVNGSVGQPVTVSPGGQYVINGTGFTANLKPRQPYPVSLNGQPAYLLSNPDNSVTWGYQQGISAIGYVDPTPLTGPSVSQGEAYIADGATPLLGNGTTSSVNFRVLGLVADSGTDFLGNSYRSCVVTYDIANATVATTPSTPGINHFQSPPQPSRFAVVPTYWDVRPVPENPSYGSVNMLADPSFEYDGNTLAPALWSSTSPSYYLHSGATLTVVNTQAYVGKQSLQIVTTNANSHEGACIQVSGGFISGVTYTFSVYLKGNAGGEVVDLCLGAATTDHGEVDGITLTTSWQRYTVSWTPTATETTVYATIRSSSTAEAATFFADAAMVTQGTSAPPYFDGDMIGYQWMGQVGQSSSAQMIEPTIQNNAIVIDSILVDPITPNMAFNVYYSTDDTGNQDDMTQMTDADWESKLWNRVPEVYLATQRQEYALPEPIVAKYVCIEFTNLHAQPYDPGTTQKPVTYKKFPTWVANFFVAEMEQPSFITDQINVQYDALDFMYNYYLDDLQQTPSTPQAAPTDAAAQLTTYFNTNQGTEGINASTLAQISLVMNQFTQTPDQNVDPTTLLGSYVQNLYTGSTPPNSTLETGSLPPVDYSAVSSLQREPVVFEQSLPVMYFFLTCRHTYKELQATFEYNRAYFCAVNEISFLREDYTTEADTPIYIESGGDLQNAVLNDFVMGNDGSWYASVGNSQQ